MNIKQMAVVNVAKLMGSALLAGVAVNLGIHYFGLAIVGTTIAVLVFAYMCKFAYDIELSKLERHNALTKLKELE
jgi:uncharacterized membrane protein YgaE (UPF0421/DUF939 family)